MRRILLGLLCFLPSTIFSQVIGHDLLAAQQKNFRVDVASRELRKGIAIGTLDTTFGNSLAPVRTLVSGLRPSFFRFHLIDGTCIRNGVCQRGLVQAGYSKSGFDAAIRAGNPKIKAHLQARTRAYKELCSAFPQTKCIGSPVLEHDLSTAGWRKTADWMLEVWPGLQLSNASDIGITQEKYRGAWIERHGTNAPTTVDIVSTDGVDITDIDSVGYVNKYKSAKIVFLWTRGYNCRTQADQFEMPLARTACPTRSIFRTLDHIVDVLPPAPRFAGSACRTLGQFKSPNVWKPLAENKGNGDPRADFPVLISPFGSGEVNVINYKGVKVGSLGYYGAFQGGLNRHYSNWRGGSGDSAYGFQAASEDYSWLQQGNKCLGPIIAGRRFGSFR